MTARHRFGLIAAIIVFGATSHGCQQIVERGEPTNTATETALQKNTKAPRHVLLMRHAEKPLDDTDIHLTSRGAARAAALPSLFAIPPTFPTKPAAFPTPDFLIAAKVSKRSNRSIETLTPLAKALEKPIDYKHADRDFALVVDHIFDDPKYAGTTVLIAWHHGNLPELALAISAKAKNGDKLKTEIPMHLGGSVYDRVWVITFDDSRNATFADQPQKLLFGDSKK